MDPKEICTKSNCIFEIKIDLTLVGNGRVAQVEKLLETNLHDY